jgi:hypothetical protein
MKPEMLKPIIEHETVDSKLIQDPTSQRIAISPNCDDRLRTTQCDQERFVAGLQRSGQ